MNTEYVSNWNQEKRCWRLVHPDTGDFICEYYPLDNKLVVTKHRKTATIFLDSFFVVDKEFLRDG